MARTLQQIKDQVASECGWESWTSLYTDGKVTNGMIAQVAIRYAEEQNRELVEMLEIINEGINTMDFTQLEGLHNEIESLINKHKQS